MWDKSAVLRAMMAPCAVILLVAGCAREARPAFTGAPGRYPSAATAYAWPPATLGAPAPPPARPLVAGLGIAAAPEPSPAKRAPAGVLASIPGGDECLAELGATDVRFERLESKKGIATPVVVSGPIGGLPYKGGTGGGLVADCRLVLALHRIAPVLKELGVTGLRYSGAYSYRMSKVGRLSYHAHGLAIDVHELLVGDKWLGVKSDYAVGLADGCAAESPPLNRVACRLGRLRLFKELLTPDYDAAHRDHFHLGIAPAP